MYLLHRFPAETVFRGGLSLIRAMQCWVFFIRVQLTRRCGVLKSRRAAQETTMKLSVKIVAAAAFAALLFPAFNLFAETGATPTVGVDPSALPSNPMGAASAPTAMPYSGRTNTGTPKVDRKSTRLNSSHLGISYAV